MASYTLTTDNANLPILRLAYGVATNAEIGPAIEREIKDKVRTALTAQAASTEDIKIQTAVAEKQTAMTSAANTAEAIVITVS